ncbi:hypothetical protein KI387_038545, partial [Taxus chinensis]
MDYYKVLGLGRDANKQEIKDAFRKLALKFHPDRHVKSSKAVQEDAMRRFKEVSEAYDVLGDAKKRAAYSYSRTTSSGFYHNNGSDHSRAGYNNSSTYSGGYNTTYQRRPSWSRSWNFRLGSPLPYFSTMDFMLHAVLFG